MPQFIFHLRLYPFLHWTSGFWMPVPGSLRHSSEQDKSLPCEANILISYGETLLFHGGVYCKRNSSRGGWKKGGLLGGRISMCLCLSRTWVQSRGICSGDGMKIPEYNPWGGKCLCAWGYRFQIGLSWLMQSREQGSAVVVGRGRGERAVCGLSGLSEPSDHFDFSFLSGEGGWRYYLVWLMPPDSTRNTANPVGYGEWTH